MQFAKADWFILIVLKYYTCSSEMLTLYSFDVVEFKGKRPQYLLLNNTEQERMTKQVFSSLKK